MQRENTELTPSSINELEHQIVELKNKIYQLENIISVMPGHVYWLDRNNIYLGCNNEQAESAGLQAPSQIIGKSNHDMIWKDIANEVDSINNSVMEKGAILEFEESALTKNGKKLFWSKKVPLFDQDKNLTGILGISFDITERRQMEIALQKAIKSKTEFLEVMSHDLRGPFNNILGAAEIARMYLKAGKSLQEIEEYLNIIPTEINRSLDLLNNVNFLLALNDGKIHKEILSVNIVNTIKKILSDYQAPPLVKITIEPSPNVPEKVQLDVANLYLALKIVIHNALRFTNKGNIWIKLDLENADASKLCIEVSDTGCGMTLEQQENIFKAFLIEEEHTERSHLRKPGLKLVIAKKLLESMDGAFTIASKAGLGTTIRLSVPFKIKPDDRVNRVPSLSLITKACETGKRDDTTILPFSILLVEDDAISLELEALALESLQQQVTRATTGRRAVELAQKTRFDIIFLDITLPDIDGVEVASQIRERWGDDITIVAVTSHALEKDVSLFSRYGMMTVIPKPASYSIFRQFLIDYTYALQHIDD